MALPGDRDLQGLPNPPGRVRRQAGAVADVKTVDGLHQAADRLLEQVGVAEGVVAKALGDVSGKPNVSRSKAMFEMDVAVMQTAHGDHVPGFVIAVVA